jgi:hypothetical protein
LLRAFARVRSGAHQRAIVGRASACPGSDWRKSQPSVPVLLLSRLRAAQHANHMTRRLIFTAEDSGSIATCDKMWPNVKEPVGELSSD